MVETVEVSGSDRPGQSPKGKWVQLQTVPRIKHTRSADSLKSGLVELHDNDRIVSMAIRETVRILGGKPGTYHAMEAYRRFPYGKSVISHGLLRNKVIPRFYFSENVELPSKLDGVVVPYNVAVRYDYDARFDLGTGPMAADVENRIIHQWSPQMQEMADAVWKAMKADNRYRRHCKAGYKFNHVSVHAYRDGNVIEKHEDRRRNGRNSMKEGSTVAVLTVGDPRHLTFHRKTFTDDGKAVVEKQPVVAIEQEQGSLFILDPNDEIPKCRHNYYGKRMKNTLFVHGINCPKEKNYFSIAFIFRCLETTAIVDATTDRVVPPVARDEKEAKRRMERAEIRRIDSQPGSNFNTKVAEMQNEWVRLMACRGWV